MKLKALDIIGFKSFHEKSRIQFPPGISAIVGPNGCGKSNIVDALRWVMGEQSVKQLRGKSMEDVIFAGANGSPPLNMAEVSLTLLNDNGSAPEEFKDYTEIMLTRRLYRSGESAYYINKQPCRLKDIVNIFLGSGMGAKSYAVIQQGNIGAIIDAGPQERRYFLEEAAGTTRYKNRKNEALRKVQATNHNLLRVSDIIGEIKRQMNGLKRQARKAERYKKHQERLQEMDIAVALHTHHHLTQQIDETRRLLKELKDEDISNSARLKKLDAAVEDIKLQRFQKNQEISEHKSQRFETVRRIDKAENDLAHLHQEIQRLNQETRELETNRNDLKAKNHQIESEIESAQTQINRYGDKIKEIRSLIENQRSEVEGIKAKLATVTEQLENSKSALLDLSSEEARYHNIYQNASTNKEGLERRLKRLDEEAVAARKNIEAIIRHKATVNDRMVEIQNTLLDLDEQIQELKNRRSEKGDALSRQVKTVQTLEFDRAKTRSTFATLKKMEENLEWYREGVRALLKAQTGPEEQTDGWEQNRLKLKDGIIGLIADMIEPESSYETAVEAVLGESLQYIMVKDVTTSLDAIDFLQAQNAGRSGFIPLSNLKEIKPAIPANVAASQQLLRHVRVKSGFETVAQTLFGHVVVADDMQTALQIYQQSNGSRLTIVTKNGNIITHPGIVIGGSKEKIAGILAKKQELRQLSLRIEQMDRQLESAQQAQTELESEVRAIDSNLQKLIEARHTAEQEEIESEKLLYKATEDLKHAERHLEIIVLEQEQIEGEKSDIDDEMAKYHQALSQITTEIEAAQERVTHQTEQSVALSAQLDDHHQRQIDLRLKLTSSEAQHENNIHNLKRLEEFQIEGRRRVESMAADLTRKHHKIAEGTRQTENFKTSLSEMYAELSRLDQTLELNEADYLEIDAKLQDSDSAKSAILGKREKLMEKLRLLELEQSQRNVTREGIVNRIEERYLCSFEAHLKAYDHTDHSEDPTVEQMQSDMDHLRQQMANIGDVNLGAINEYEQLKSRYDFLCEQRDDLKSAIDDLHKVIRKINRITQKRFMETFDAVNGKLKKVFPRLFEGGSAKLMLTDPQDLLETGVEYMIHPPGKKLTRMSLLSGGEKALAAIAFIFSIFLLKPASFCLMDEIDAPLDEANIYRFNDLLKLIGENSQIVVVTHNKKTMEFADTLFGITMETKGISKVVSVNFERN